MKKCQEENILKDLDRRKSREIGKGRNYQV